MAANDCLLALCTWKCRSLGRRLLQKEQKDKAALCDRATQLSAPGRGGTSITGLASSIQLHKRKDLFCVYMISSWTTFLRRKINFLVKGPPVRGHVSGMEFPREGG